MIGARLVGFGLLTCAAFAWSLPWLDRPGTAALGLAFAVLVVGRVPVATRPTLPVPRGPAILDGRPLDPVPSASADRLAMYGAGAGNGDDAA